MADKCFFSAGALCNAIGTAMKFMGCDGEHTTQSTLYMHFDGRLLHVRTTNSTCLFSRQLDYGADLTPWAAPALLTRRACEDLVILCKSKQRQFSMGLSLPAGDSNLYANLCAIPLLQQVVSKEEAERILDNFKILERMVLADPFYYDSTIPPTGIELCSQYNYKTLIEVLKACSPPASAKTPVAALGADRPTGILVWRGRERLANGSVSRIPYWDFSGNNTRIVYMAMKDDPELLSAEPQAGMRRTK